MPANTLVVLVLVRHHHHGIPPHQALDPALQRPISRIRHLLPRLYGVHVIGIAANGEVNPIFARTIRELFDEEGGPVWPRSVNDLVERFEPFRCFAGVQVDCPFG